MIYEKKLIGDKFSSICSEKTHSDTFDEARNEIISILKKSNFNIEESNALLKQIIEYISQASTDLIYSQDLKSLF